MSLNQTALSLALAGSLLASGAAMAADYPVKAIRMIVPYSAGGGADNAARIIAKSLGDTLKQPIVIENKAGASGSIGATQVARATADGYTLLYDASSFSINPVLRKLPYEPLKDFVPVSKVVSSPYLMVVPENSPYNSVQSYVDAAKAAPGKLTFASYGIGSPVHIVGELLKQETGINIVHVPYKGGAPALVDVMSGVVDTYFANAASAMSYIRGKKLKALASTAAKRGDDLPDVPTMAEQGVKMDVSEWNGIFAPAGTPEPVIKKLSEAIATALKDPQTIQQLNNLGMQVEGTSPEAFRTFISNELTRWGDVAQKNNIKLD
ncbi:MFS transporter [Advenella kashmirensis W13003]|uniref:MFS transporter n=1 Tax=Advenella kashmirensis W13003 TaxID=1424334 RepID=V8QXG4_9BURK|nr:tripartite tricarboxylate transporter substrate binding protein [Advenella kashmirensis]ETF04347.1 MFS transporter [Advenella kashmirensis W13003]